MKTAGCIARFIFRDTTESKDYEYPARARGVKRNMERPLAITLIDVNEELATEAEKIKIEEWKADLRHSLCPSFTRDEYSGNRL